MTIHRSTSTRAILAHFPEGATLPEAIVELLRAEGVATGTVRGHGILRDATLRVFAPALGGMGLPRRLAGASQAVTLDGSIGMFEGSPAVRLRAVLSRETETGVETVAGDLEGARVLALELLVTSLDDVAVPLVVAEEVKEAAQPAWSEAVRASPGSDPRLSAKNAPGPVRTMPQRPPTKNTGSDAAIFPEAGDAVEHFAFGTCDVIKSDGDRLHLRVHKDQRVKEIALEMLRVHLLSEPDERPRRFKLERKL
ncbi:MAG TPA: PPC domain-containing DNA-binding protein [Polyangiaceae bacterium]